MPSPSHSPTWSRSFVDGPDELADPELREVDPVEDAGGEFGAQELEAPGEIAFVLAAERVEPERPPYRRRVAVGMRSHSRSKHLEPLAVRVGRPRPARVPPVGVLRHES